MKNKIIFIVLFTLLTPNLTLASWWNPFTWFEDENKAEISIEISTSTPIVVSEIEKDITWWNLLSWGKKETYVKQEIATTTEEIISEPEDKDIETKNQNTENEKTQLELETARAKAEAEKYKLQAEQARLEMERLKQESITQTQTQTEIKQEENKNTIMTLPNGAIIEVDEYGNIIRTIQEAEIKPVESIQTTQQNEQNDSEVKKQATVEEEPRKVDEAEVTTLVKQDTIPPTISQIYVHKLTDTEKYVISWSTDEPTSGKINFGGQMSCSIDGCQNSYSSFRVLEENKPYSLNHQIIIDVDLHTATEYKYYIYAIDEAGNETGFYDGEIVTELSTPLPELKGQYNIDLVLTKDKGPYTVTGDVFINKNITIEPGVEIKLNDYKLVINNEFGEIRVMGAKEDPVLFIFNQFSDNSNKGIYIRSNGNNIIDNAIIEFAFRGISIDSGKNGIWAKATVSNSIIRNNSVGVFISKSNAKIINNTITQNYTGIQGIFNSIVEISQNNISNNSHIALSFESGAVPQLKFNNIYGNNDIMRIHAHPGLKIATFFQNNILLESNEGKIFFGSDVTGGIWNATEGEIDAQNNWWGTSDISVISPYIKEYHDVFFDYQPIATSEVLDAGVQ